MASRPTLHPLHVVLHRPLRLGGVDARLLALAIAGGFLAANVAERFTRWDVLFGLLAFLVNYGVAWIVTRREPSMVSILLIRLRYLLAHGRWQMPTQFDPLKRRRVSLRLQ